MHGRASEPASNHQSMGLGDDGSTEVKASYAHPEAGMIFSFFFTSAPGSDCNIILSGLAHRGPCPYSDHGCKDISIPILAILIIPIECYKLLV